MAYLTNISTSSLSNQNISSTLLIHTFTNTTRVRKVYVNVFADQVAGNGDYKCSITVQRSGSGSAYQSIITTNTLASGVTSAYFGSIAVVLGATDVMKVYLLGLAGDTTTPDTTVDVIEEFLVADTSGSVMSSPVTVATNNDKTGYSLTQSFPNNFSALSINSSGSVIASTVASPVTVGTNNDKTGYSLTQTFPANFSSLSVSSSGSVLAATVAGQVTVGGYASGQDPANLVLNATASSYDTALTIGEKINAAGGASDPLTNLVPGSYGSGTAGAVLGGLTAARVTVVNPLSQDGSILTIVRGDDYLAVDNRALEWTDTTGLWPDLTSGSVVFTGKKNTRNSSVSVTGTVVTPTGSNKKVRVEPTHTNTTSLKVGNDWQYDVQVTLPSGSVMTLVRGAMQVVEDFSAPS